MLNTRTHNDQLLPIRHRRSSDHRGAGGAGGEQRDPRLRDQRERDLHLQTLWGGHAVKDPLVSAQIQGKTCKYNLSGLIFHARAREMLMVIYLQVHNVCLFRCEKCEIFFKSKKGYEGHVANRHTPR